MKTFQEKNKCKNCERLERLARIQKLLCMKYIKERIKNEAKPRPDLLDNFHWILMRARRSKHITQKQLAEAIGEPEVAIKKAEEGALPENNYLLNKIQSYLKINLFKDGGKLPESNPATASNISIEDKTPDSLTISDLKKLKEKKIFGIFSRKKPEQVEEKKENQDKDLSEEEIRKLIFKK